MVPCRRTTRASVPRQRSYAEKRMPPRAMSCRPTQKESEMHEPQATTAASANHQRVSTPTLHHVNLKTVRLDAMIDWYGKVVGLEVAFRFDGGAWLTNDEANHRVALLTSPALSDDDRKLQHTGLHHTAFEYGSLDALLETYARLKADDIRPHFAVDHGMTTSFYYADPDGNSVELQVDNFGDWSASSQFIRTAAEFAADPIGELVDPDLMIQAREDGAPAEEIHRRGYAGEFHPSYAMDPRIPLGA
jgi:catechol 2,3-dioxygenase